MQEEIGKREQEMADVQKRLNEERKVEKAMQETDQHVKNYEVNLK